VRVLYQTRRGKERVHFSQCTKLVICTRGPKVRSWARGARMIRGSAGDSPLLPRKVSGLKNSLDTPELALVRQLGLLTFARPPSMIRIVIQCTEVCVIA
jgi:hypothetical protein